MIKTRPNGFYYIEAEGVGGQLSISENNYTSLSEANRAIAAYQIEHQGQINKMRMIENLAGPRPHVRRKNAKSNSE